MAIAKFLIFLFVAHLLLLQIFRLSTYHRYFFRSLPLLVGYAAFAGFVFQQLWIAPMFLWYLAASAILLWLGWRVNAKEFAAFESVTDNDQRALLVLSAASTRAYFLTSAVLYLLVFSASFLYFYN